jgi:hypothetical protein
MNSRHRTTKPSSVTSADTESDRLLRLNNGLAQEKERLLKQAVSGTRYSELPIEDKRFISTLTKELVQYEHYIKTLSDAAFLNNFIRMVQRFAQSKFRSIYLGLLAAGRQALGNSLEEFLFHLREFVNDHSQINGYLNAQCFRTWAIGSKYNPICEKQKYKSEFRYAFPACDFNCPLVLQNPNMWVDNAALTFYNLVDAFSKFKETAAYVMTPNRLVWLGSFKTACQMSVSSDGEGDGDAECGCGEILQLHSAHLPRMSFNLLWLPQLCASLTFKRPQSLCGSADSMLVPWADIHEFEHDLNKRRALLDRMGMADGPLCVEFYYRPDVDWGLYLPFECQVSISNPGRYRRRVKVTDVSMHPNVLTIDGMVDRCYQGKRMAVEFVCSSMEVERWKPHLDELVGFYKQLLGRIDMLLLGTESQTKQLGKFMESISRNVSMQEDLLDGFVGVNNAVVIAKLNKINQLIQSVNHILRHDTKELDVRTRAADPEIHDIRTRKDTGAASGGRARDSEDEDEDGGSIYED